MSMPRNRERHHITSK